MVHHIGETDELMEILTNSTRGTQARRCAASTIVMRATMTSLEPATVTVIFTKQIPRGVFELTVPGLRCNLWLLDGPRLGRELAAASRRLAWAVGGDLAVCHPGASLRLPGTRNGKPGAGERRLLAADLALSAYALEMLGVAVPEAGGAISCPLLGHEDAHRSFMVYAEPARVCRCFSHTPGRVGRWADP